MAGGSHGFPSVRRTPGVAMRRKLVLGVGLAGVLANPAAAQFASDAKPFGGAAPAARPAVPPGPAYVPPVGGFTPAPAPSAGFRPAPGATPPPPAPATDVPAEPSPALGANHPLQLRAEHGSYFVLVKSYSRPARPDPNDPGMTARELAEGLAAAVRQAQPAAPVYLFEHVSDEKKTALAAAAAARRQGQAFMASVNEYRRSSQLQGLDFLEPDNKVRFKSFGYRDQIGVFVGGYATEEEAVRALAVVKKWPPPADNRLLDGAALVRPVNPEKPDGRTTIERTFINPFTQAMVVPNPLGPRKENAAVGLDPFIVKLNDQNPYSLLKATKTWTLGVKSFDAPLSFHSDGDKPGVMSNKPAMKGMNGEALTAAAGQAENLAKALREMRDPTGKTPPLEAFVLHTRYSSLVTVGQFDGPNDPALLETRRQLQSMRFGLEDKNRQRIGENAMPTVFQERIIPVPIPKP